MTVYIILFFLGFILAICLLAYTSIQVEKLSNKADEFGKNLKDRYSKPLTELEEAEKKQLEEEKKQLEEAKKKEEEEK
jgi:sensor histidine kinase YesM